ncbi:MAG: hypothetical protein H7Y04_12370 [Verrucomicrobia bacterium]|nr:hypothetical protein [Cytophagales bacterium]
MKRIVSILLLLVLCYNMVGYYFVYSFRQLEVKEQVLQSLAQKADQEFVIIKIRIPAYYVVDKPDFESISGEFMYEGKMYEKVKQKIENYTLHIYCVHNKLKDKLLTELSAHNQEQFADFTGGLADKSEKLFKNFLKEYLPFQHFSFDFFIGISENQPVNTDFLAQLPFIFLEILQPPPEQV